MNNFNWIGLVCAVIAGFTWALKAAPDKPVAFHLGMALGILLYPAIPAAILALLHYLATRKKTVAMNQAAIIDDMPATKPRRYWPLFFNYLTVLSILLSAFLLARGYDWI